MKNRKFRNKKMVKVLLSALTALALVFGEIDASLVYALPTDEVSENAALSEETADAGAAAYENSSAAAESVVDGEAVKEETVDLTDEPAEPEAPAEEAAETVTAEETVTAAEETGNNESEEAVTVSGDEASQTEEEKNETVSGDTLEELSKDQIETAEVLKEELEKIEDLEENEDYVADEAVFMADTRKEALDVAGQYGATLTSFSYGVATLKFEHKDTIDSVISDVVDTVDAVAEATEIIKSEGDEDALIETVAAVDEKLAETVADVEVSDIPDTPIYTNYIYHIEGVTANREELRQWYHGSDYLNTQAVWSKGGYTGEGVKVAVLDTGIDSKHSELVNQILAADHVKAFGDSNDNVGHGTHVAGIIAADANNGKVVGIAPGAKIYSVKVSNSNEIVTSNLIEGIEMAINKGVDVINMSLGGTVKDSQLYLALNKATKAGIVCVAAAGNLGNGENTVNYPANYGNVISVAAYQKNESDKSHILADYSNYLGNDNKINIVAPGSNILSTYPTNLASNCNGYYSMSGTSMAAPMVAGAAALVMSKYTNLRDANTEYSAKKVTDILINNTNEGTYTSLSGEHKAIGGLDIAKALGVTVNTVAAPSINTSTDSSTGAVEVTMTAASEIRYETSPGSSASTPTSLSNKYTSALTYKSAGTYTISAIAVKDGVSSSVVTKSFTVTIPSKNTSSDTSDDTSQSNVPSGAIFLIKGQSAKVSDVLSGSYKKYKSSKSSVASVTSAGVIKGKAKGTADITATASDGSTGKVKVYVEAPKLNKLAGTYSGQTLYPSLTNGSYTYASLSNVTQWVSSKPSVATIDSSSGEITVQKAGSTKITAKFGNVSISTTLTVKMPKLNSYKDASIVLGGTVTRKVTNVPKGGTVTWEYNDGYVSVSTTGAKAKFTLINPMATTSETTQITAYVGENKIGTFNIKMSKAPEINKKSTRLKSGKSVTLKVKNVKKAVASKITWSAENMTPGSASGISKKFKATGLANTSGTVTVSIGDTTIGTCIVTIK